MRTLKFARKSTHTARKEWRCTFCYVVRPAGTNYEQHVYMTDECDGPTIEKSCKGRELADVCEYWQKFNAFFADVGIRGPNDTHFFYEKVRAKDGQEAVWRAKDHARDAEATFLTIVPDGFDHRVVLQRHNAPQAWLDESGTEHHSCQPEETYIPYFYWFRTEAEAQTFYMMWGGKQIMTREEA